MPDGSEFQTAGAATVNRDWSNNVTNKHRCSKILLVVVDTYQSVGHSRYVLLSDSAYAPPPTVQTPPLTNGDHEHTLPSANPCI